MVLHGVHASLIYVWHARAQEIALSDATVQMSGGWIYAAKVRVLFGISNRCEMGAGHNLLLSFGLFI